MKTTKNQQDLLKYNRQYQENRRRTLNVPTKEELKTLQHENFIQNSTITHNNKYDYSLVEYKRQDKKVNIICPIHGDFLQTPDAHLRGQGCPICAHQKRIDSRNRRNNEDFIYEASTIHLNKYEYNNTKYYNLLTKVNIDCPDHGEFSQTPKAHLKGQGCPMCANERRLNFFQSKGENIVEEFLINNNITYETQKMFQDCKFKNILRYDFYLPEYNTLIEFDGEQHFKFIPKFHKNIEMFHTFQERDKIKNKYALDNNIQLIRIKFNQQSIIPSLLSNLQFSKLNQQV